jgi:hypothetical protein
VSLPGHRRRSVGPTAASKTLHFLRPEAALPWDAQIAGHFPGGRGRDGYLAHLHQSRTWAKNLVAEAAGDGLSAAGSVSRSAVPTLRWPSSSTSTFIRRSPVAEPSNERGWPAGSHHRPQIEPARPARPHPGLAPPLLRGSDRAARLGPSTTGQPVLACRSGRQLTALILPHQHTGTADKRLQAGVRGAPGGPSPPQLWGAYSGIFEGIPAISPASMSRSFGVG